MYKLRVALVVALVAALTALIAGVATAARLETAILRSIVCFLVFGGLTYAVALACDRLGIIYMLHLPDELIEESSEEVDGEGKIESEDNDLSNTQEAEVNDGAEEDEHKEGEGFVPLSADDVKRVPI